MKLVTKVIWYLSFACATCSFYGMDKLNLEICKTVRINNPDNTYELHCYDIDNIEIKIIHVDLNGKTTTFDRKQDQKKLNKTKKSKSYTQHK